MMCSTLLQGCSIFKEKPSEVRYIVVKPDKSLLQPCSPLFKDKTPANIIMAYRVSLERCNLDKKTIRLFYIEREREGDATPSAE